MDINDFRGFITAFTMLAFIGFSVFAWRRYRHTEFEESARRPLEDDHYINEEITNQTRENT